MSGLTSLYCTLADAKSELQAESNVDDAKIMRFIKQLSRRIDQMFRSRTSVFVPVRQARNVSLSPYSINSYLRTLDLGSPMMSLSGITTNGQSLVVGSTVQSYPVGITPFNQVQLLGSAYSSWYAYAQCADAWGPQNASVSGVWGYSTDYSDAWLEVDSLTDAMTDSALTFTVEDVDGENPLAEAPRISAGHVVQIDDEWMDVVKTNTVTNSVTVRRGVNGTTAAAHDADAVVSVFQVEEGIRRIARQACLQYARQGAFNTITISGMGQEIRFPQDLLEEITALVSLYANM